MMANLAKRKILGFSQLEEGWCFAEGISFSKEILHKALDLYQVSQISNFTSTDAFPGLCGEITLALYHGEHYYEFTIESDFSVTFIHEIGEETCEYTDQLSISEAKKKILKLGVASWSSSELYTQPSTIGTDTKSKVTPSKNKKFSDGKLSIISKDCVISSGKSICEHIRTYYQSFDPPMYWEFDEKILPTDCSIEQKTSRSGDVCHHNVLNLSHTESRNLSNYCKIEEVQFCNIDNTSQSFITTVI